MNACGYVCKLFVLAIFAIGSLPVALLAQGQRIRVTASLSDVSINKIPFIIAENEGLYTKHGLEVVMTPFSASATVPVQAESPEMAKRLPFKSSILLNSGCAITCQ